MTDDPRSTLRHGARPRRQVVREPGVELTLGGVPVAERDFFIEEFHGVTIVVALPALNALAVQVVARTVDEFVAGDTRFVFVVATEWVRDAIAAVGGREMSSPTAWGDEATAELWLSVAESSCVVVGVDRSAVARTAGVVSAGVRASKMVLTDPGGGWDDPPRSFADIDVHHDRISAHLAARGLDDYIPAARQALAGGAYSVNLCRAEDLEFELLTFEGRGTVLTQGRYLHIEPLRVDDFPAIEALVAQGVGDGTLKPRHRIEVAKMAASGIGARVLRTGHLAGIVGLETDRYAGTGFGEVSGLITVAEFSGLGAGGLLMDGLLDICREKGLANLFAVTVSAQAADFFAKRGFREVSREDVPAAKWEGYEADRFDLARCFVRSAHPVTSTV